MTGRPGKRRGWVYYDLEPETIRVGLLCGLMQKARDEDGVFELTPKGLAWLIEFCDDQVAIARMWAW